MQAKRPGNRFRRQCSFENIRRRIVAAMFGGLILLVSASQAGETGVLPGGVSTKAPRPEPAATTVRVAQAVPAWSVPGGPLLLVLDTGPSGGEGVRFRYRVKSSDAWTDLADRQVYWSRLEAGVLHIELQAVDSAGRQSEVLVYERTIQAPAGPQATALPANAQKTLINSVGMYFTLIPPGEFAMGSAGDDDAAEKDEMPLHGVRLTRPFYLGTVEVTRGQFRAVMNQQSNSGRGGESDIAEPVDWETADYFCGLLSRRKEEQQAGRRYRLPTEAEWEYACRAGTATRFHVGDKITSEQAAFGSHGGRLVSAFAPNAFGLYDMHGNVSEWCSDWFGEYAYWTAPAENPTGPASGKARVARGGSLYSRWQACRSAARRADPKATEQKSHDDEFGFRVVCEIDPADQRTVARTPFFDKTLSNWEGLKECWWADDEGLHGRSGDGTALISRETYRDFELSFSVRVEPLLGMFRLYFRGTQPDRRHFKNASGVRLSINNADRDEMRGKIPNEDNGTLQCGGRYLSQPSRATHDLLKQSLAKDRFYRCDIRCVGQRVTAWIDSVPIVDGEFKDMPADEGLLMFQIFDAEVTIKDIRFRDLGTGSPPVAEKPAAALAQYDLTGTWVARGQGAKGRDLIFAFKQNFKGDVEAAYKGAGTGFNKLSGKIVVGKFSGNYQFMSPGGRWGSGSTTWILRDRDHASVTYRDSSSNGSYEIQRRDSNRPDLGTYGAMERP